MLCVTPKLFIGLLCCLLTFCVCSFEANAQDVTTVNQRIVFKRGSTSAVVKKQIRKGTSHQYRIRAKAGQEMTIILTTGKRTSFSLYSMNSGVVEGADGETMWKGSLPDTGEYEIVIGTDATANYKLEIFIR